MDLPRMLERPALYPAPRNLFKGTVTILSKVNPLLLKEDDLELDAPVSQVLSAALNRTVYRRARISSRTSIFLQPASFDISKPFATVKTEKFSLYNFEKFVFTFLD